VNRSCTPSFAPRARHQPVAGLPAPPPMARSGPGATRSVFLRRAGYPRTAIGEPMSAVVTPGQYL
jgi:hypothetical protein